jgi:Tfp pilus assembly protein PilV
MKTPISQARRRKQGGNALIEFAISGTLILIIFSGVAGFARVMALANMAAGAAEAGVQYGALSPAHYSDLTGMQTAALNDTGNLTGATATATQFCACSVGCTQVSCPATCGSGTAETYVQVSVTIPYNSVITFPMIPNPVNITQTASARVQ